MGLLMNKQELEIGRILSVSTAHIKSKKLMDKLSYEEASYNNDYGCILYVDNEDTFDWNELSENVLDWEELSEELAQLSKLCRENHCCWLVLDESGPEINGIKTYNW